MVPLLLNPHVATIVAMTSTDPTSLLANYGFAGIVLILVMTGQFRTKAEVEGLKEALKDSVERERQASAAIAALVGQITAHTLPQISQLAAVVDALPGNTERVLTEQVRVLTAKLDKIERLDSGGH